jgi:glycosyltransferase involved in cell wall biosynthesis
MNERQPRVLLLAEMANPNWISVPLVGWMHVQAISEFADVHLVTHERNRENILACGFPADRVSFVTKSLLERSADAVAHAVEGEGAMGGATRTALAVPAYYLFERAAHALMRERLGRGDFDLVHRVTPVSPALPSPFVAHARRLHLPFVVGPLNGGVPWPRGYADVRRREGEWVSYARGAHKLLPHYRSTRRDASAVLCGSAVAWREASAVAGEEKCFYVPENAVSEDRFEQPTAAYGDRPLPVAFCGRLVPYKGADLLMEAAAPLVRERRVRLDIIGDGPDRQRLERLAGELALGDGVAMPGWVEHERLSARLRCSAVFAFPSLREFGGAVVMEAMMLGLVPIVLDWGGPAEVVGAEGFRVPLVARGEVVRALREVLAQLSASPGAALAARGHRARERALSEFTMRAKADKTRAVYAWVTGRTRERPNLLPPAHALALYA